MIKKNFDEDERLFFDVISHLLGFSFVFNFIWGISWTNHTHS